MRLLVENGVCVCKPRDFYRDRVLLVVQSRQHLKLDFCGERFAYSDRGRFVACKRNRGRLKLNTAISRRFAVCKAPYFIFQRNKKIKIYRFND